MKIRLISLAFALSAMTAFAADLPQVAILATGDTIAGTAAKSTEMAHYKAGDLAIQTLIDAVPDIQEYASVTGEQIVKISSNNLTDDVLLKVTKRTNELLADPKVSGVVITHGTDTLEETAWFLNLTVKSRKPVIVIGAMRPATAISADGPVNLLNAVRLAADPKAADQGVLIALNDEINSARDASKTSTTSVSTFKSPELGLLGYIAGGEHYFLRKTLKRHTWQSEFDISGLNALPQVEIIYSHANAGRLFVDAAAAAGVKGIIHAGTGDGSIHKATEAGLLDAMKNGMVAVRSARVGNGVITGGSRYEKACFINAGTLSPQKARILLQLALTKTSDPAEIQRMFNEY